MSLEFNLDKFRDNFIETPEENGIDASQAQEFIKDFYGNQHAVYSKIGEDNEQTREQIDKLCKYMEDLGLQNFGSLRSKFISPPDAPKDEIVQNQLKESMETIAYVVSNVSTVSKEDLVREYQDRTFVCAEGTLTNVQSILSEMTLANQGIDAYIIEQKKHTIFQIAADGLRQQKFAEFSIDRKYAGDAEMATGMEIHDASSIVNSIAEEYHLLPKSEKEDVFIQFLNDSTRPAIKATMEQGIQEAFSSKDGIESFIDGIAQKLLLTFPGLIKRNTPIQLNLPLI